MGGGINSGKRSGFTSFGSVKTSPSGLAAFLSPTPKPEEKTVVPEERVSVGVGGSGKGEGERRCRVCGNLLPPAWPYYLHECSSGCTKKYFALKNRGAGGHG